MQRCQYFQEFMFYSQPQIPVAFWKSQLFFLNDFPASVGYPEKTKCDQHNTTSLKAKYTDPKEYVALKHHYCYTSFTFCHSTATMN